MSQANSNVEKWFNECYDAYADSIFRFCLVKVSNRELALDLSQEAFTRLWDMLRAGKEVEQPRALLFTIARNAITDYYRKKKEDSLDAMSETGFEPEEAATAEVHAEYTEALSTINELEEPFREAVYLRYVEELPPREIARITKNPVNVVSIRITRGMKQLREVLGQSSL